MQNSEQQLKLYRLLFENSLGLMCIHDLDGVLLAINPATAESLGYRVEDGIGRNLREFLAPPVRHLFDAYLERIRVSRSDSGLMRLMARDGSERVWFYRNLRHEEPESPPCVLGHALDITERVRTEQALKESQRALTKTRDEEHMLHARNIESLGVLAGGIAHDFNNILTVVQGNTTQAQMTLKPGDPLIDILCQIERACQQASSLTLQLLTFAKGGAPIKRTTSVVELVEDSVELASAGSPVGFEVEITPDLWSADVDAGQIKQVLHNVLLNARQAMPGNGVISVRASNIVCSDETQPPKPGKYVQVSIEDQGCGIPAEIVPKIFDPYFSTKKGGSGLGLATAYSIVAKHDGHISVESIPDIGTTLHIYLPAAENAVRPVRLARETPQRGSAKVLVMDDEEAILKLMKDLLTALGYEVECASEGSEAIDLFSRARASGRNFDAVLLDLTVPGGMGGKETAARIREIDAGVRLIVSSGYSDAPVLAEFRRYGFDDVISKPWSLTQLSDLLKRATGAG